MVLSAVRTVNASEGHYFNVFLLIERDSRRDIYVRSHLRMSVNMPREKRYGSLTMSLSTYMCLLSPDKRPEFSLFAVMINCPTTYQATFVSAAAMTRPLKSPLSDDSHATGNKVAHSQWWLKQNIMLLANVKTLYRVEGMPK